MRKPVGIAKATPFQLDLVPVDVDAIFAVAAIAAGGGGQVKIRILTKSAPGLAGGAAAAHANTAFPAYHDAASPKASARLPIRLTVSRSFSLLSGGRSAQASSALEWWR